MKDKLKALITDIRSWSYITGFIIVVVVAYRGYANLPKAVSDNEREIDSIKKQMVIKHYETQAQIQKTNDSVDKLAQNVNSYITMQTALRVEDKQQRDLMLKLIEKGQ